MKYKGLIILLMTAILFLGGAIINYLLTGTVDQKYQSLKVSNKPLRLTVRSYGVVSPMNRLEIKPPVPGRIESILIEEGMYVKKGKIFTSLLL